MRIGSRVTNTVRDQRLELRGVIVTGPRRASRGMAWVLWHGSQAPEQVNRYWLRLDRLIDSKSTNLPWQRSTPGEE